jgi:DNA-binding MarR family transcriptional regulator
MDNQDLRTLKILEEIDNDHTPSQRDLAKTLDISLGLVNSFVKRLAQKGYFKIRSIPKNRVRYILTPKGAAEKTRLTYEFIQYSFQFYKESRKKLQKLFIDLASQGVRRIVFYGVTDFAEIAYLSLQETRIQMVAIFDDSEIGNNFLRFVVANPENLTSFQFDKILISDPNKKEAIMNQIITKGILPDKIITLD